MSKQEKLKYLMLFLLGGIVFLMFLSVMGCKNTPRYDYHYPSSSEPVHLTDEEVKTNDATKRLVFLISVNQHLYTKREAQFLLSYLPEADREYYLGNNCPPSLWARHTPDLFLRDSLLYEMCDYGVSKGHLDTLMSVLYVP